MGFRSAAWLRAACLLLGCQLMGACAQSDAAWVADLQDPDAYVRGIASIGLGLQSPQAAGPALPVLLETVDRSEVGLEREAAAVLSHVGAFHVDALLHHLTSDGFLTEDRRGAILNALVAAGDRAPAAIVDCLRGPGRDQAVDLGDVLLLIGPASVPAVSELAAASDDTAMQHFAIFLLARLGPGAREAVPVLQAALDSPDPGVQDAARQALQLVDPSHEATGR